MHRVFVALFCAFILAGGQAAMAQWAPKEFPISFWCGPPPRFVSPERFKQVAAAGFNLAMPACEGPHTPDVNLRILDACKAAGIKAFVMDQRMPQRVTGEPDARARLDAIVKDYGHHPALAGYFITDEPGANAFDGLAEVVRYLREKDPAHPAYINLFPNYASPQQLDAATYEEYLNRFIRTVHPFVVSYDHYHFLKGSDRPGFFANLNQVREAAQDANLPFWQIVLAVPHLNYRPLTEAEKRWEAMHTLAYGGKGLMYFTYWTPSGNPSEWGPAIISYDGTPTPQYDEVRRINADVRAIGRYLLNSVFVTVFQNGPLSPGGTARQPGTPVAFRDQSEVTAGLFRADTHLYTLLVNRNYKAAVTTEALFSCGSHRVQHLDRGTGRWIEVKGTRTADGDLSVLVTLAPGDGELYRW
ncbi:MAG: hypothetical protein ACP5VE_04825 [Chthonomonadales bacterium]